MILLLLISPYCNIDAEFINLCKDLQNIKSGYRDVKITYTLGDPVSVEKDGGLVITQTESSIVDISEEQLERITDITKSIRNRLISNN